MKKENAQPEAEDENVQQNNQAQENSTAGDDQENVENQVDRDESPKSTGTEEGENPTGTAEEATVENAEDPTVENIAEATSSPEAKQPTDEHDEDGDHEQEEDEQEEDDHEVDYSDYSKKQLVELIKELAKSDNVVSAERKAREIRPHYDEFFNKERGEALERFKADGGTEEDFSYKLDELDNIFEANYKLIRDRKYEYQKSQEQRKDENLKKKQDILERLREFVDSGDANFSFETFKQIQEEWKSIGPIPQAQARTLWANYNALVDRFYDNRSIYFELKELDRKKNLEAKQAICEKAENLVEYENIKEAIKELNDLHNEFKHVGPVPKDEQENVWQRFKAASDAVYSRRKEFIDGLKEELTKNEDIKKQLADKVQEFVDFDSDRIKAWNEKTKEILALQKQWEAVGGLPRAHAREINKKFWNSFKKFFQHKSAFFKKLDSQREENLAKKQELVKQANEIKESTDWQETADKLKNLQRQWKDIGPVPEKVRDQIYKEFKEACDYFFDRKRTNTNDAEKDFHENLAKKEAILNSIEDLVKNNSQDIDALRELQEQYDEVGFVPKRDISRIKDRYTKVVDSFIAQLKGLDDEDKEKLQLESQIIKMKQGPNADHKLHKKEVTLRKQIAKVENEIATYKNNMEFFASSRKADKLKDEFQSKIDDASEQLKLLKQQLKIVRNA